VVIGALHKVAVINNLKPDGAAVLNLEDIRLRHNNGEAVRHRAEVEASGKAIVID
jgi:hypothetical protein